MVDQTAGRSPYDGKPYYCVTCGIGFAEYAVCEELDCKLETLIEARDRQRSKIGASNG